MQKLGVIVTVGKAFTYIVLVLLTAVHKPGALVVNVNTTVPE